MPFVPTTWIEGSAPGISALQLNRIEAGIKLTDAGVFYGGNLVYSDTPSAYTPQMVTAGNGQTADGWPFFADVLTLHGAVTNRTYMHQLIFGVSQKRLYIRSGFDSGGTAWNQTWKVFHSDVDEDLVLTNTSVKMIFQSASAGWRFFLNVTGSDAIGYNMGPGGTEIGINANNGVAFMRNANSSHYLLIDTLQVFSSKSPVVRFKSNADGLREEYNASGNMSRGIVSSNVLYDMVGSRYKIFSGLDNPASAVAALDIDVVSKIGSLGGFPIGRLVSGNYQGDGTQNRLVNVGFTPAIVIISNDSNLYYVLMGVAPSDYGIVGNNPQSGSAPYSQYPTALYIHSGTPYIENPTQQWTTIPVGTTGFFIAIFIVNNGFRVGGVTSSVPDANKFANFSGITYRYVAIG